MKAIPNCVALAYSPFIVKNLVNLCDIKPFFVGKLEAAACHNLVGTEVVGVAREKQGNGIRIPRVNGQEPTVVRFNEAVRTQPHGRGILRQVTVNEGIEIIDCSIDLMRHDRFPDNGRSISDLHEKLAANAFIVNDTGLTMQPSLAS